MTYRHAIVCLNLCFAFIDLYWQSVRWEYDWYNIKLHFIARLYANGVVAKQVEQKKLYLHFSCLLYTSDAADE